nr:DUF1659 domain-containing protein [Neobacillus sp. Marseille-Q6967]
MAQALLTGTKLRIVYQVGLDDEGKPVMKAKTFNNVKRDATVDQLWLAAEAIFNLSADTLSNVEKIDSSDLMKF